MVICFVLTVFLELAALSTLASLQPLSEDELAGLAWIEHMLGPFDVAKEVAR